MKTELYPWQKECLDKWLTNNGRGMVQAVTGSGKTLMALHGANLLEQKLGEELRVKIVVPTGALMLQWNRALREFLKQPEDSAVPGSDHSGISLPGEKRIIPGSCSSTAGSRPAGVMAENPRSHTGTGLIGLRGNGYKGPADRKYTIYVINSARYELARQILKDLRESKAVLLIADECHHYDSEQNRLIFEFLPYIEPYEDRFFSMGLSATLPAGQAWQYLSSVLGKRIYSYGIEEASALNTVCRYDIYHIGLSFQPLERTRYQEMSDRMGIVFNQLVQRFPSLKWAGLKQRYERLRSLSEHKNETIAGAARLYLNLSYKRKSLVCLASARTACTCDLIRRLNPVEQIMVFGERISQVEELYRLLEHQYPGKVGRYHSQMGQQANKNVLERFRHGELRILIACKAMDEGVDLPDVSVGIILSGTSTQRQRIQRLGRIIRKKAGKTAASLYYLHVAETSEDACFLPAGAQEHLFELEYSIHTREFCHPAYDKQAARLLERMEETGMDGEKADEIKRCLRLGCVRSDWTQPMSRIEEQIRLAGSTKDKNYWVCMKMLNHPVPD